MRDYSKQVKINYNRAKTRLGLEGDTKPGDLITALNNKSLTTNNKFVKGAL